MKFIPLHLESTVFFHSYPTNSLPTPVRVRGIIAKSGLTAQHANSQEFRVQRDFYARRRDMAASPQLHIYCSIYVDRLALTRDHEPCPGGAASRQANCGGEEKGLIDIVAL